MTNKIYLFTLLIATSLFAIEIPTSLAKKRSFSSSVSLNAQVIQLSNASQAVTSQISGHLEQYYVKAGQRVKAGQKVALIESIEVSKMTADYISLKKQYRALNKNYNATKKLYKSGMTSMQELNKQSIQLDAMSAQINALQSQLKTLNIDTDTLKIATPDFILYAHSAGRVSQLLQTLHTVVKVDESIINIVKEQAFYIKSFLPLEYATSIKAGLKIGVNYNNREISTHVTQILPSVDETTQRIVVLSSVDEKADDLFINTYLKATIYFEDKIKYVAVEKSALSFFNNEWVVFLKKEHEQEQHKEEDKEHDEHELPYEVRVVEIIASNDKYVGVKGLEVAEEYVSDKSYYVKSMILKSSLGEHGH